MTGNLASMTGVYIVSLIRLYAFSKQVRNSFAISWACSVSSPATTVERVATKNFCTCNINWINSWVPSRVVSRIRIKIRHNSRNQILVELCICCESFEQVLICCRRSVRAGEVQICFGRKSKHLNVGCYHLITHSNACSCSFVHLCKPLNGVCGRVPWNNSNGCLNYCQLVNRACRVQRVDRYYLCRWHRPLYHLWPSGWERIEEKHNQRGQHNFSPGIYPLCPTSNCTSPMSNVLTPLEHT